MGELPVICFALTWIVFAGYTYAADLDLMGSVQLTHLLIFSIAFYLIFLLSVASIVRINIRGINQYLLGVIGLNNFVFLFFALCLLQNMELEQNYKGLVTLLLRLLTSLFSFGSNGKGTFHFLDAYVIGYRSYVRIGDDPDPTGRDLYYLVLGFRGNDYSLVL